MNGSLIASLVLGSLALAFLGLAVRDRVRTGVWSTAARTHLVVTLVFGAVVAWLAWLRVGVA